MITVNDVPRFEPGDIYFYNNPYSKDKIDSRINVLAGDRPVLILSVRSSSCMVIPLTTKAKELNQINLINQNTNSSLDAVEYMSPRKITEVRNSTLTNFLGNIGVDELIDILQLYPIMINAEMASVNIETYIRSIRSNLVISINNENYLILVDGDSCLAAKVSNTYNSVSTVNIESKGLLNGMYVEGLGSLYKFKLTKRFKVLGALSPNETSKVLFDLLAQHSEVVEISTNAGIEIDNDLLDKICSIKKTLPDTANFKTQHPALKYAGNMPQKVLNKLTNTDELIALINRTDAEFKEDGYSESFVAGLFNTLKASLSNEVPDNVIEALISRGVY